MAERYLIEARNCTVAIAGDRIVEPEGRFDHVLKFPDADVRPGLINAHDHLHRNHYGRLGHPPYKDAYEWAADIQQRCRDRIEAGRKLPRREALLRGAWKNLFAGVTSVVHHDPWEPDFDEGFPLRVVPLACPQSLGVTPALDGVQAGQRFALHLAEGVGRAAADEVRTLHARGLLGRDLIAVHGIGMDAEAIELFRNSGAALVWCPTSNLFLFGCTAPGELLGEGVDVLLGSDSLLTGDGNLLDELRAARATGLVSDRRLEDAVGPLAARRLGLAPATLAPNERADLVVLSRPLLEASAHDVRLVVCGGVPRVADPASVAPGRNWRKMTLAGVTRWINDSRRGSQAKTAQEMNLTGTMAAPTT